MNNQRIKDALILISEAIEDGRISGITKDVLHILEWNMYMRDIREKSGLSLREVAKRLKISPAYLSDIELGKAQGNRLIIRFYEKLQSNNK